MKLTLAKLAAALAVALAVLPSAAAQERSSALSANGSASNLVEPAYQIYSVGLDGRDRANLSGGAGLDTVASPGPDGRIAFVRWTTEGPELWVMDADGTEQRRLVAGGDAPAPAWSPDGRELAVGVWNDSPCGPSDHNCALARVALVDADTGAVRRLIASGGRGAMDPSWAPDGKRLVFTGRLDFDLEAQSIEIVGRDGRGRRTVVSTGRSFSSGLTTPEWSPGGGRIAFGRSGWIWLVKASGGEPRRLVLGSRPVWAPDGSRLAFEYRGRIGIVDLRTSRVRFVARGRFGGWSPGGGQLAYTASTRNGTAIRVTRVTGGGTRTVIEEHGAAVGVAGYSSDGRTLVFVRMARP